MEEEGKNRPTLREGQEELFSIYGLVESEVWELHIHDKDDMHGGATEAHVAI